MVSFKIVIGFKNGQCVQKEVQEPAAKVFLGKKIGNAVSGNEIGFEGYEFEITGGSDYAGFPMRKDLAGFGRKKILTVKGVGVKRLAKGIKQRKTVCGNTIHPKTSQINLKVVKEGKEQLVAPKEKAESKSEEKAKEVKEKARETKAEGKELKEEAKAEKPNEEKKESKETAEKEEPEKKDKDAKVEEKKGEDSEKKVEKKE